MSETFSTIEGEESINSLSPVTQEGSEYRTHADIALGQLSVQAEINPTISEPEITKGNSDLHVEYEGEVLFVNNTSQIWLTNHALSRIIDCNPSVTKRIGDKLREDHPDWFEERKTERGNLYEHLHPEAQRLIQESLPSYQHKDEEWVAGVGRLAKILDVGNGIVKKIVDEIEAVHPEWIDRQERSGKTLRVLHPELVEEVRRQTAKYKESQAPPEGSMTINGIANLANSDPTTVKRILERLAQPIKPGVFGNPITGHLRKYYSPDDVGKVIAELNKYEEAPEQSETVSEISKRLKISFNTAKSVADSIGAEHPELFGQHKNSRNRPVLYCYPEAIRLIEEQLGNYDYVPSDEGWMSWPVFSKQAHNAINTLQNASLALGDDRHALIRKFKNSKGAVSEYCHPEAVRLINLQLASYELAPLDWQNANNVAAQCGTTHKTIYKIVDQYRDSHPEWFGLHKSERNAVSEYYHPALILEISAVIEPRNRNRAEKTQLQQEQSELRSNVQDFLKEVIDNDSIEAQEFRGLINLFGGERVIDLLYQYHPEYKKIPVPYVKSVLADYLGDFLAEPSSFDLDEIETGIGFLYDSNLRDGLIEVVKRDCLSFYSQQKLENLTFDDLDAILGHINDLRVKTADFNTEGLGQVFDEVENYYRLLFEEIQKPDCLVDELKPGRAFPDLNQRINIHEISTKHKILIADEMGVGKSASAILTKEFLGVEQALIVVPSNVIETWKAYLSDLIVDGETVGYFKAGQAPRVLVAESLEALQKSNPDDYDYVILSQERLNERYVEALGQFNYGMLIVDEVHKMKNLIEGKRAENLIELAERINDQNGAKYLAILSGTPIPNKVGDIAMILKLLYPEKFERVSNQELTSQLLKGDVLDLRSLLVPRMQMKSLAESVKMPKLEEKVHEVELTAEEREIYEILLEEDELTASQKMQILRKFTLNPSLLDATPDMGGSKIQEVGASLGETFSKKDKVIMFVNGYIEGVIRGNNTIIEALNLPEDVEVFAIEGEVEKDARLAIQQELQSTGRKILVLVSGQTADVGVDFSGAEELYFYNEPWTEYDKKQQLGRVFRPGLKDDLIVRTFITTNTIEEGIHGYIKSKYRAVEKLLRGIPITDLEREMLKHSEDQNDSSLEVNPELAEYYFSSWDRLMKIYGHVKELGEDNFVEFLAKYGREYADSYTDVGGRSYQANASRLSGTLIDRFAKEKRKNPEDVRLLDIASGPEMLRRHIADEYSNRVISLDINEHHFAEAGQHRIVGSFLNLPIAANSIDYANLALALHYTNFVPSKGQYERIEVLREANRVLSIGGRVVISLMHTRDLKDESAFREAVTKLGFRVVERYTGKVEDGTHFRTRLFTLEKTHNGPNDVFEAVKLIGPDLMKGFKFTKRKAKLRDSRKISTSFAIEGQPTIKTRFNDDDLVTLKEEQLVSGQMARLKQKHGSIRDIPRDEVLAGGFSRIFNGKSYVLFKRLVAGSGSVVLR